MGNRVQLSDVKGCAGWVRLWQRLKGMADSRNAQADTDALGPDEVGPAFRMGLHIPPSPPSVCCICRPFAQASQPMQGSGDI